MTPKQKQLHIEILKSYLNDFTVDRYGNYLFGNCRIKFKKVNVRIERKHSFGWVNIISKPAVSFTKGEFKKYIKLITRSE